MPASSSKQADNVHHQATSPPRIEILPSRTSIYGFPKLIFLVGLLIADVVIFQGWHLCRLVKSTTGYSEMPWLPEMLTKKRTESKNNKKNMGKARRRIVTVYNETHPLISVAERSKAGPYRPFPPLSSTIMAGPLLHDEHTRNLTSNRRAVKVNHDVDLSVHRTRQVLASMGVDMNDKDFDWSLLPPWSQIIDNYHDGVGDDGDDVRPIMLGLDRCQAFREAVPPRARRIAPAGMFSTGTNLLFDLLKRNCNPPNGISRVKRIIRSGFALWQVPWGKHNPESARLHYAPEIYASRNQTEVLPVVMIRHPYTWINAMCLHSYSSTWRRNKKQCGETAMLKERLTIQFGSLTNRTNHTIKTRYDSVAHLYQEWYRPYYQQTSYPAVMVRMEDLVFQPKEVVTALCQCVGGTVVPDDKFVVKVDSANGGKGHGSHRSGLLSAFVKYGRPLEEYYSMLSTSDRLIVEEVFRGDKDMFEALGYKL